MMLLYHLTWERNVAAILGEGLRPNVFPNPWHREDTLEYCRRGVFLCAPERREYWTMTFSEWLDVDDELVWLVVDVTGLSVHEDDEEGWRRGDYYIPSDISPRRIARASVSSNDLSEPPKTKAVRTEKEK